MWVEETINSKRIGIIKHSVWVRCLQVSFGKCFINTIKYVFVPQTLYLVCKSLVVDEIPFGEDNIFFPYTEVVFLNHILTNETITMDRTYF